MLAILVVNWNVRDLLRACLMSLIEHHATRHAQVIFVVDNASSDLSVEMVRRDFPDVRLIVNTANRGYTGGNNDGIAAIERWIASDWVNLAGEPAENTRGSSAGTAAAQQGSALDPRTAQPVAGQQVPFYLLVLNPDTVVTPGALDTMLAYADQNPTVGVVGPQLRYPDGQLQPSKRHYPTLATTIFLSTWLERYTPSSVRQYYFAGECGDDETCDVDWLVGAALLVRREAYLNVGVLDEATFFMYSEEIDWCKRIKAAGWRVVYLPQAVIVHHEAKSSDQVSTRRMIHFNTSKVRYMVKHHGQLQGGLARTALLALLGWQWLIEAGKWLVGHKRPMRAERLKAYATAIKSGLK